MRTDVCEALNNILIPHFDENGTIDPHSASQIVGINRDGELVLKGSFMTFLIRARAALAKARGEQ